jgi:hypothetical protein
MVKGTFGLSGLLAALLATNSTFQLLGDDDVLSILN